MKIVNKKLKIICKVTKMYKKNYKFLYHIEINYKKFPFLYENIFAIKFNAQKINP